MTKISDFDDVSEFCHTVSLLSKELSFSSAEEDKLLSEIKKINNLIFVGCFCSDGDSPYLWGNYGQFNIKFSKHMIMNMVHYQQQSFGWIAAHSNFLACNYCIFSQNAIIKGAINQWKDNDGYSIPVDGLSHLCTLFKKSEFFPEQEIRLVLYLKSGSPVKKNKGNLKEYWELPMRTAEGVQPIQAITVGPMCRPEEAKALRNFLNKHQLVDISVKYSTISSEEFAKYQSID